MNNELKIRWRFKLSILAGIMANAPFVFGSSPVKPNILFIVGDDMGYADVGFQNCKDIPTPNLDALAKSGVQFSNGYVSGPYCSPTRAGLLTGRYQQRFGHEFNPSGNDGLPLSETTIANRLKTAGYITGLVGKWHLGAPADMQPQQRGFDEFFGFLGGSHSYFNTAGILRGTEQVNELDYTTDAFGREAISFMERHKAQPWFLYLAFNAVHTPMDATDDRLAKFTNIENPQRRTYDAMMLAMDETIGKVLKKLGDLKLEKNTLVIFISDNGGPVMKGTTINGSMNTPFRGGKRTTLEGGIHVPFIVSWPGKVNPGRYESPVIQLDLNVTALNAAGVEVKPEWKLDGVNLLPYITGKKSDPPHQALFWRMGEQMAIRLGDFKLVRYDTNADTNTGGRQQPVSAPMLYNLKNDISESKDLSASMPEKVRELQKLWDAWNSTLVKPLWGLARGDSDGAEPGIPGKRKNKDKVQQKAE